MKMPVTKLHKSTQNYKLYHKKACFKHPKHKKTATKASLGECRQRFWNVKWKNKRESRRERNRAEKKEWKLTGTRLGYFLRIFSPSSLRCSNVCSSLYWNFILSFVCFLLLQFKKKKTIRNSNKTQIYERLLVESAEETVRRENKQECDSMTWQVQTLAGDTWTEIKESAK